MRKLLQVYYLYLSKPTIMLITFYFDLNYFSISQFPNNYFKSLYLFTFLIKPIFYLGLLIGFTINSKTYKFKDLIITIFILLNIFFGFPIKEFSEIFCINALNEFFEGKQYILKEYVLNHFIVNLIIENIPIILFVFINNLMIGKFYEQVEGPIIINILSILINGFFISCIF